MFARDQRFSFKDALPKNIYNSSSFNVRFERNDGKIKVGVVVSKRVDLRSSVRNRIKRVIIEEVRKVVGVNFPFNIVFYVKKSAISAQSLENELENTLNKIKNV